MTRDSDPGRPASSPCMAAEVAPDYFDPLGTDPQQARDVARWRRAERARLLAARLQLSGAMRARIDEAIAAALAAELAARLGDLRGRVVAGYWPIRAEPDLRPMFARLRAAGAILALPVVETRAAPLVFRAWVPEVALVRGHWNILVPPPTARVLVPVVVIAPLVGWDGAGFRLGYGGGYFDRTLAALQPRPLAIGVGYQGARLPTIYPQPHDIRLDAIVTEAGPQIRSTA
ncbi:5-formyltetrahydrofolate cyclo-ligase [Phaeovulum sp. NW3]|uniref:5-formyltetrahydrofolate cyclo-ligase n=1 Tax=Phaeovulum sp. NW3 TaxID=2934933 RepID=UPI00201FD73E|nr:5-formyltetrahydrofolate cyclo-ligase [Phaeovulum sp. NW3]MCL7464723.1 5-formyltetrahydrofolate cyclo-ligase [Phaeovulum sp. NW3]